jgi:transcriptional regulator GlxA family with amidase domain
VRIDVLLFDGFDELDAIGPYEVLANARAGGAELEVALAGVRGTAAVTGSHGTVVTPHRALGDDPHPDLVVVPGGGWNDRAEQGAWEEARRGDLPSALADLHASGTTVASVCTGGMLLAAAGLTTGRPATTHHAAIEALRESGAEVVDARVVDDGDVITAGGVTSGIDLALWLVEREFGAALADAIAREMEHDRRGDVWRKSPPDVGAGAKDG